MRALGAEFEEFVAARGAVLMRTAFVLTGDRHLAEDLLQSALGKAATRWRRLQDPEAYIRRCMYNEHVSRWRRLRHLREDPLDTETALSTVVGPEDAYADRDAVVRALLRLAPRQRAVLVLRYYEDMTEAQTADMLGVSIGTVKSQTSAALRRLRETSPELGMPDPTYPESQR